MHCITSRIGRKTVTLLPIGSIIGNGTDPPILGQDARRTALTRAGGLAPLHSRFVGWQHIFRDLLGQRQVADQCVAARAWP